MRLLNVHSLQLEKYDDIEETPEYAILSHRWSKNEMRFGHFQGADWDTLRKSAIDGGKEDEIGIAKILSACAVTKSFALDYLWIDTCCIDGSSSTEVTQAINSMFRWYQRASVCLAYLFDVSTDTSELGHMIDRRLYARKKTQILRIGPFEDSQWFRRGWTLQELLAPPELVFYDHAWRRIGVKTDMTKQIQAATRIDPKYLTGDFEDASIATKLSWVSDRTTTLPDDMAYCMVGILGVSMDTRYGEEERAFMRLQELLIEKVADDSIFAWTDPTLSPSQGLGLLAPSPACFRNSSKIHSRGPNYNRKTQPPQITSLGLRLSAPAGLSALSKRHVLFLDCWEAERGSLHAVTILLGKDKNGTWRRYSCNKLLLRPKPTRLRKLGQGMRSKSFLVPQRVMEDVVRPVFHSHFGDSELDTCSSSGWSVKV
ncbi:hypothetical protein PRZ48_010978 [Zasmidium cellare]|uniref:HET-domain-containing protein n=1 Tax=Zasmidium cellare TaxID=395010 RepID=A0ABR0EA57_ZASCE|nr:hypothetical protein PRZ48_010978 [Zasmidium cellare]